MDSIYAPNTINPFALAELVAQKRIDWSKYDDETQALCEILNIPADELFYGNCPVMTPYTEVLADGTVKRLSDEEARERLENYLAGRLKRRISKKPPISRLALKAVRTRIPDILVPKKPIWPDIDEDDIIKIEEIKPKPLRPFDPPKLPIKRDLPWNPEGFKWSDAGMFFREVPEYDDPAQGALGDCSFMASLSALAWTRPYAIKNEAKASEFGDESCPSHAFTFYDENRTAKTVEVTDKILMRISGKNLQYYFASSTDKDSGGNQPDEIWPAVIEKAYVKWQTGTGTDFPNYTKFDGSFPGEALCHIRPGTRKILRHTQYSSEKVMSFIKENCDGKKAKNPLLTFTPGQREIDRDRPELDYASSGIVVNHSYTILGWEEKDGVPYVVLRNPWARKEATKDVLSGEWEFNGQKVSGKIPLGRKGVFALRLDTYMDYYVWTEAVLDND